MAKRSSPPILPSGPVGLLAVAVGCFEVILAWTECGAGGLGFRIGRATCNSPCTEFSEIGRVGPNVAAFRDGTVKPHTTYNYRVHAWNASGDSSPSNVAEVTTPSAGTDLPTGRE